MFNLVIQSSEKHEDLDYHLQVLYNEITITVYKNVSRGLFEKHKLMYSFMLLISILLNTNKISQAQWNFVVSGAGQFKAVSDSNLNSK